MKVALTNALAVSALFLFGAPCVLAGKTQNVVLIVSDGLRWQEIFTWIAVMGPETAPLGERTHVSTVTQAQIAATVAALVGKDYHQHQPKAALPIEAVLSDGTNKAK